MLTILWVTLLMGLVLLLGVLECRTARRTLRSKAKRLDCVSVSDAVEAAATTEENADAPPPPEQHAADGSDERMLLLGFLRAPARRLPGSAFVKAARKTLQHRLL